MVSFRKACGHTSTDSRQIFTIRLKNITDDQVLQLKPMTITHKDWIDLVKQWKDEHYQVIRA